MNLIMGKAAAAWGWQALKGTVSYASSAISGHVGMGFLNSTVMTYAEKGKAYGPVGEMAGTIFGKVIAGQGIEATQAQVQMLDKGLTSMGLAVINAASSPSSEKNGVKSDTEKGGGSSLTSRALQVGKVAAVVAGGVAIAGGLVPAATVGLVSAAATALPKIAQSALSEPTLQENTDFVENIVVRAAKTVITESAATLVGNYVRYDQVLKAYDFRCEQGKWLGENIFGSYTPEYVKNVTSKVGKFAGTIDAGRYAMSAETIKKANGAAETAEQLVKAGFGAVNVITTSNLQSSSSTWDTARKTLWVAGAVLSAAALVVVAPEIAPFVAGTATLSATSEVITWAKSQGRSTKSEQKEVLSQGKAASETKSSEDIEDFVILD
jgi:hypothetical protein